MAGSGGTSPLKRVCLGKEELQALSKEDLIERWHQQDQFIDSIELKVVDTDNSELVSLRESEEKLKQQQMEASRKENILLLRLTTKEQEMQEYGSQIQELKQSQVPTVAQLRAALLDPAVNLVFEQMRKEVDTLKARLEETQNELSAWKFTPDSNTGKRLMAKCRLLYQENEELGKVISSGRMAKLEGDLALQRNFSEEMKKSQAELDEFLQELDEDVDGMQSTIIFLQQQLRESKEQIAKLQAENKQLSLNANLHSAVNSLDANDMQLPHHFQNAHHKINSNIVDPLMDVQMSPERPETPPTPVYSEQPNTPETIRNSEPLSPDPSLPSVVRLQEALTEPIITFKSETRSPEITPNQTPYLDEQPTSPEKLFIQPQSPQVVIELRTSEPLQSFESKNSESVPLDSLRTHDLQEYRIRTQDNFETLRSTAEEPRSPVEIKVFDQRISDHRSYETRKVELLTYRPRTPEIRSFAPQSPENRTTQNSAPQAPAMPIEIRSPGTSECSVQSQTPPPSIFVLPVSQQQQHSPRIVENTGHVKPTEQQTAHQPETIHPAAYTEKPSLIHENGIKQGVICYGNQALLNENAVIVKQERIETSPVPPAKIDAEDPGTLVLKTNIIVQPEVVNVEIREEPLNLMANSEDSNAPLDLVKKGGVIARGYGDGTSNSTIITSHMATNVIARCHPSEGQESDNLLIRSTVVKNEPQRTSEKNVTPLTPSPPQSPDPIPTVSEHGKRTRAFNNEDDDSDSPKRIKLEMEDTIARDQTLEVHIDEDTEVQVAQTLACWAVASKERLEASKVLDPGIGSSSTSVGVLGNGDLGGNLSEEGKA